MRERERLVGSVQGDPIVSDKQIALRPATSSDFDFLFDLHRAAMRDYIATTWGWDENWQREYFQQHFTPEAYQIITVGEQDVGVVAVRRHENELFLSNIEILPEHQNKGIGTAVISRVVQEARQNGWAMTLQVLKVNPARRLYERLGFVVEDETATHYTMRLA